MHFGELLKALRQQRGLTQRDLADRAGMSESSIRRAEATAKLVWRRSAAREVYAVLAAVAPLSATDAKAYFAASGLDASIAAGRAIAESPAGQFAVSFTTLLSRIQDPTERQIYTLLQDLIDKAGADQVLKLMHSIAEVRGLSPPRTLNVIAPPRQIDLGGVPAIEQRIRTVEVHPKAAPLRKPERRAE